jgi:hypothetical protein
MIETDKNANWRVFRAYEPDALFLAATEAVSQGFDSGYLLEAPKQWTENLISEKLKCMACGEVVIEPA